MKYFTSIFGFFLLIILPIVLIFKYRQRISVSDVTPGKLNKSIIQGNFLLYIMGFLGMGLFVIIVMNLFIKNNKTCVAEEDELTRFFIDSSNYHSSLSFLS